MTWSADTNASTALARVAARMIAAGKLALARLMTERVDIERASWPVDTGHSRAALGVDVVSEDTARINLAVQSTDYAQHIFRKGDKSRTPIAGPVRERIADGLGEAVAAQMAGGSR